MNKNTFRLLAALVASAHSAVVTTAAPIPPPPVLGVATILRNGIATNDITHCTATFTWQPVASATDGYQFHAVKSNVPVQTNLFHTGPNTSVGQGWTGVGTSSFATGVSAIRLGVYTTPSHLTSPLIDLTNLSGALLTFGCRFDGSSRQVRVLASLDPNDWSNAVIVGNYSPPTNTLNPVTMDLSAFCGKQIYLRFQVMSGTAGAGAGIANIRVHELIYDTLQQCDNVPVAAGETSFTLGGLAPRTGYFIRARSMGSDDVAGNWSAFLPFTTLPAPKGTVLIIR